VLLFVWPYIANPGQTPAIRPEMALAHRRNTEHLELASYLSLHDSASAESSRPRLLPTTLELNFPEPTQQLVSNSKAKIVSLTGLFGGVNRASYYTNRSGLPGGSREES
jgi:hypothetical protein